MNRNIKEVAQTWIQRPKNRRNTLWERGYNIEQLHQGTKEGPGTNSSSRVQGHWTWNSGWRNPVPQPTLPSSLKMQQHAADHLWTNHSSIQPHIIDHSATTPMKDLQCHAKRAISPSITYNAESPSDSVLLHLAGIQLRIWWPYHTDCNREIGLYFWGTEC